MSYVSIFLWLKKICVCLSLYIYIVFGSSAESVTAGCIKIDRISLPYMKTNILTIVFIQLLNINDLISVC